MKAKIKLRDLLARQNRQTPYRTLGKRCLAWFGKQDFGPIENLVRDELVLRLQHYEKQLAILDEHMLALREAFPQVETLTDIHGIGLYSALLIVAELGEVDRFHNAKQVGAYTGLTARVNQSGGHCYRGSITRQGSSWLRWILVEAAMKVVQEDVALKNFYTRVRKRASAKIARVATAQQTGGDMLETAAPLAEGKRSLGGAGLRQTRGVALRTQNRRKRPAIETGEALRLCRDPDWVLLPVNRIMCGGLAAERHEWVTTICATHTNEHRTGILPRTFRPIHRPTRAAHCRPWTPASLSLFCFFGLSRKSGP